MLFCHVKVLGLVVGGGLFLEGVQLALLVEVGLTVLLLDQVLGLLLAGLTLRLPFLC